MSTCTCATEKHIPGVNSVKGSSHLAGCSLLRSYLFYWEEAVNAWVPTPEQIESIISTENIDPGEESTIRFTHFRMTPEEYDNLPVD